MSYHHKIKIRPKAIDKQSLVALYNVNFLKYGNLG